MLERVQLNIYMLVNIESAKFVLIKYFYRSGIGPNGVDHWTIYPIFFSAFLNLDIGRHEEGINIIVLPFF